MHAQRTCQHAPLQLQGLLLLLLLVRLTVLLMMMMCGMGKGCQQWGAPGAWQGSERRSED